MIKSKFVTRDDIIQEKPEQFKKIKIDEEFLYIYLYEEIIYVPKENVKEFFLNNDKTIINCKILAKDINDTIYKNIVEEYFYNNRSSNIEFSTMLNSAIGQLNQPIIEDYFELLFLNEELVLNILIENSKLK